ncbi:PglL family O-oligosaccharyltransferase [Acidovorax sp. LjRoot117]|uniref:PglL family O-oligosaccharyltransferase n=1 Tax=Acidovorax sp. LjRoot117 TaxID=3342255 RepID=UPI003ECE5F43
MLFDAIAIPLSMVALALPFVFGYTDAPNANFWPLIASWACGLVLMILWSMLLVRAQVGVAARTREQCAAWARTAVASQVAAGLVLAAILGGTIGLVQYFSGDAGLSPWIQGSMHGQAIGNLRQRNQQATLLSLGGWALLWLLAQIEAKSETRLLAERREILEQQTAIRARQRWCSLLAGMLLAWVLVLLVIGSAATASRTGALQWLLIVGLLMIWRASSGRAAIALSMAGLVVYAVAAWLLPQLLQAWTGFTTDGLFNRIHGDEQSCNSRRVLWMNVLHLIAQKPWLGWGWGELDYAHYVTVYSGERFCLLLDNAHNLPLHLAVELGLPVAFALCSLVLIWCVRARPWRETDTARQLAWGILAIVGVHSMLEFPLWYGPFQVVTLLAATLLLWRRAVPRWVTGPAARAVATIVLLGACALGGILAWDYYKVSLLYRPSSLRPPHFREDTMAKVSGTPFFSDQVDFALLSATTLTQDTAPQVLILARELLHFSPEPRVIELLIESAAMLGKDEEAEFHTKRYRLAYPTEYLRWKSAGTRIGTGASQALQRP